jgi:hypothetical protein
LLGEGRALDAKCRRYGNLHGAALRPDAEWSQALWQRRWGWPGYPLSPQSTSEPATSNANTSDEQADLNRATLVDALPPGFVEATETNIDEVGHMADLGVAQRFPATDGLPDGMRAGTRFMTFASGEIDLNNGPWCTAFEEKSATVSDCVDDRINDIETRTQEWVQPGRSIGAGDHSAWVSTRVNYEQPAGDVIVLDIYVWTGDDYEWAGTGGKLEENTLAQARQWIDNNLADLVAPIADPAIQLPVHAGWQP